MCDFGNGKFDFSICTVGTSFSESCKKSVFYFARDFTAWFSDLGSIFIFENGIQYNVF